MAETGVTDMIAYGQLSIPVYCSPAPRSRLCSQTSNGPVIIGLDNVLDSRQCGVKARTHELANDTRTWLRDESLGAPRLTPLE